MSNYPGFRQQLKVDKGGKTLTFCMDQYKKLFNVSKTPGYIIDKLHFHFKTGKLFFS